MKNIVLIIVDMQNDFVLKDAPQCIDGALKTTPNLQKVLQTFRDDKSPVSRGKSPSPAIKVSQIYRTS